MKTLSYIIGLLALSVSCIAQETLSGTMTVTSSSGKMVFNVSGIIVTPADYYVSPATGPVTAPCVNGSDGNSGTDINHPFATLDKARSTVRPKLGSKPFTVMLCGGIYFGSSTTFQAADSGTVAAPVTYTNYTNQTPILSGGTNAGGGGWSTSTTGTCASANSNGFTCYRTSISNSTPYFETLYYQPANGVMSRRMRPRMGATANNLLGVYGISTGPISGSSNGCGSSGKGEPICGLTYTAGDPVSAWSSCVTGTDCLIWAFGKWAASIQRIDGITTSNHQISTTCNGSTCPNTGDGNAGAFLANERYIIENIKELLAFGGQWYLDRSSSNPNNPNWTLYYVANSGENPNNDTVLIPNNTQVITATSIANATFSGLTFQNDNFVVPSAGYLSTQLDHNLTQALVTCGSCVNVNFIGDTFSETIASGLRITDSSSHDTISGNVFADIGAYGLQLGVYAPQGGNTDATNPNHITATQNWIEGTGRFFPSADGVMVGLASNVTLTFNDIGYAYDKGFEICQPSNHTCSLGSATDHDIDIENNEIHQCGQGVMTDLACFYASTEAGTNNTFSNNRAHDANGARVQNPNEPDPGVHVVYLDDETGNWTIKNNVLYRGIGNIFHMNCGPQGQTGNGPNLFQNNILADYGDKPAGNGGMVGIQISNSCTASFLAANIKNNIMTEANSGHTAVNWGHAVPQSGATGFLNFVSNLYDFAGTEHFNSNVSFATWKSSYGEDSGGSDSASPGFVNTTICTPQNDPNWPYPDPGVCDDFRFNNGQGPGFGFVYTAESYGPSNPMPIPPYSATFPEAVLSFSSW